MLGLFTLIWSPTCRVLLGTPAGGAVRQAIDSHVEDEAARVGRPSLPLIEHMRVQFVTRDRWCTSPFAANAAVLPLECNEWRWMPVSLHALHHHDSLRSGFTLSNIGVASLGKYCKRNYKEDKGHLQRSSSVARRPQQTFCLPSCQSRSEMKKLSITP